MAANRPTNTTIRLVPLFLGFAGILLATALGALAGHFHAIHFALLGLSVVSIAGGLLWLRETRWRETLSSLVYSVFFVISLALVYLISANRTVRFDLTAAQVHTLSPQTVSLLRNLPANRSIVATIFVPERQRRAMEQFLSTYQRESPQFRYQLYDADRDLDVVAQYAGAASGNSMFLTLLDEQSEPVKKAPPEDLTLDNQLRENLLTNAIARLVQREDEKFYYSIGHREKSIGEGSDSLAEIMKLLADTTLPVEPLRLTQGIIPEDAAAIIIAGPTIDFFDAEVELLKDYLDQGGKLFVLLDPIYGEGRELENLGQVLAHAGLRAPNEFIVDPGSINAMGSSFMPLVLFTRHPIGTATNGKTFVLDRARPVASTENLPQGVKLEGVLVTSKQTWTEPAEALRSVRSPVPPTDPARIDAYIASVSSRKPVPSGRRGDEMRVVLIGDSDAFINQNYAQNGDAAVFFIQTMNWLRKREELLRVPPRLVASTPITLTKGHVWMLFGGFLFAGLAITIGGTAWTLVRRRTR